MTNNALGNSGRVVFLVVTKPVVMGLLKKIHSFYI